MTSRDRNSASRTPCRSARRCSHQAERVGACGPDKAAVLRAQRLDAVDRVAAAAKTAGAATVLVAGDVLDSETLPDTLAGQLLSRLKSYPRLIWHLLPGNHDPARAGGVWE